MIIVKISCLLNHKNLFVILDGFVFFDILENLVQGELCREVQSNLGSLVQERHSGESLAVSPGERTEACLL